MTNEEIAAKGGEIAFNFGQSFANAMNREMKANKVSVAHLSRRIGVSCNSIRNWRRKDKYPTYENMGRVAAYFGYDSIFTFIGGEEIQMKIDEWIDSFKGELLNDLEKRAHAVETDSTQQ